MRCNLVVLVLIFTGAANLFGQRQQPRGIPEMGPKVESESEMIERHLRNLRDLDIPTTEEKLPSGVKSIYRRPSADDLRILTPSIAAST